MKVDIVLHPACVEGLGKYRHLICFEISKENWSCKSHTEYYTFYRTTLTGATHNYYFFYNLPDFGLVCLMNLVGLFNAKAMLVEELYWYYLTCIWG